jgi:hypothetical protein
MPVQRNQGVHYVSVLSFPYCIWSQAYQMNVATVIGTTLYTAPLLRQILDKSGMFDNMAATYTFLGHVATLIYMVKLTFTKPVPIQHQKLAKHME